LRVQIALLELDQRLVYFDIGSWRGVVKVSVSEAKAQLTELVRRAEEGHEVILTRHGQDVVRLVPERPVATRESRRKVLEEVRAMVRASKPSPGPSAARSQDFLYDDEGLPK
jgi:prevent-host-death family protein